jgi:hypothetical protein
MKRSRAGVMIAGPAFGRNATDRGFLFVASREHLLRQAVKESIDSFICGIFPLVAFVAFSSVALVAF